MPGRGSGGRRWLGDGVDDAAGVFVVGIESGAAGFELLDEAIDQASDM